MISLRLSYTTTQDAFRSTQARQESGFLDRQVHAREAGVRVPTHCATLHFVESKDCVAGSDVIGDCFVSDVKNQNGVMVVLGIAL